MPRTSPLLSLLVSLPLCLPAQDATALPHGIAEPTAAGGSRKSIKEEQAHVANAVHAWVAGKGKELLRQLAEQNNGVFVQR